MPYPYEPVTVEPREGGALITQESLENVGAANYSLKRDWRRSFDAEIRREGDILFQPSSAALNNQPYPAVGQTITLVHTCRRANGQIATVVGTQTTLYRYFTFNDGNVYTGSYQAGTYDNESGDWYIIGKGFSTNGARWEAVDVGGYTIFNNGYDLPVAYDLSKRFVVPLHELREQGIAAVGTITTFNGMLLCQDITNMTPAYTTQCLNGVSSGGVTASQSGTGVTANSNFFTSSMVGQTIIFNSGNFHAKIVTVNSATVVTVDTQQNVASTAFSVALLFGPATDATQTSRVRYQIINSNVGDPTAFGSLSTALVNAGSAKIVFTQPMYSLKVGDSVIVTGVGASGTAITANILAVDNIYHDSVYIDQIPLTSTESVTFTVAATAHSGSLSYQWMYNGETIVGATKTSYSIPNISTLNAGNYNCVIYDASGSVSSNVSNLQVFSTAQPPIITAQPSPVTCKLNANISFTVVATSYDTPTYQWSLNGTNIPGAVGSVFTIPSVLADMQGQYSCAITNAEGTTVTNLVALTVADPSTWTTPTIVTQPANLAVTAGNVAILKVAASGVPDVTYQWQLSPSWTNIGTNSNQLIFTCAASANAGTYRCVITNAKGAVTSASATLTVNAPSSGPTITLQTLEAPPILFAPAAATIQKSAYPGSAISSQNLQDDGSAIIRSIDLRGTLVVFKETTIFIGTFTGTAGGPIAYQKVYSGPDCLYWKWMLTEVDGTYIIYATQKDFFTFDLTLLLPRKHPQLRNASGIFYGQGLLASQTDRCFVSTNELTREVWFAFPTSTAEAALCFDYEWNTCSTTSAIYTSCATIEFPTATTTNNPKRAFVMGDATGTIRTYGLDTETGSTFLRNGLPYDSIFASGYVSFGNEYGEKALRAYMAFCRLTAPFTVTLFGTPDVQEAPTTLFTVTVASPTFHTLIPCYFLQNYYQDQILVTGSAANCSFVRRVFDPAKVDSRGTIKHS